MSSVVESLQAMSDGKKYSTIGQDDHVLCERKMELGFVRESMCADLIRATCAEFIGMILFLFGAITVARFAPAEDQAGSTILIAFAFGLSIFVLVYMLAEVSGANLNPAVSIALVVSKRISVERFVLYVAAQIFGGILGAMLANTFMDTSGGGYNSVADGIKPVHAFYGEILCTFYLVTIVFAATDGVLCKKLGHIGALLPFAIGMTVLLDHLIMIPVDGCSINPARTFATSVTNNNWDNHWVFWAGPLTGGVLGAVVWETILRPAQPVDGDIEP